MNWPITIRGVPHCGIALFVSAFALGCGGSNVKRGNTCDPGEVCDCPYGTNCVSFDGGALLRCGAGTHQTASGACVADVDRAGVVCGSGTELVGGECVASVYCGAGTHLEGTVCMPDPGPPASPDDGGTTVACGDGTHLDRGACIPDDPAAALGASAPCLGGGNRLAVYGEADSFVYPGAHTVIGGTWASGMQWDGDAVLLEPHSPGSTPADPSWFLLFGSSNTALTTGLYSFDGTTLQGGPQIQLQWGSSGCLNGASGAFQVDDLTSHGDVVDSFTVTFWQQCAGHSGITRGCAHVGP